MRTAVLVAGYIVLGYCVAVLLSMIATDEPGAGLTFVGLVILSVPIVLGIVYAHSQRNKK
jgi:hypothetical protein